ncbi:MAG: hypothetical protein ACOYOT_02510 [Bacteroidales bacterium]
MIKSSSLLLTLLLSLFVSSTTIAQTANDWENPTIFQINRLPARSTFMNYADRGTAIADDYSKSPYYISL